MEGMHDKQRWKISIEGVQTIFLGDASLGQGWEKPQELRLLLLL